MPLRAVLPDSAALYGLIGRIEALGLVLLDRTGASRRLRSMRATTDCPFRLTAETGKQPSSQLLCRSRSTARSMRRPGAVRSRCPGGDRCHEVHDRLLGRRVPPTRERIRLQCHHHLREESASNLPEPVDQAIPPLGVIQAGAGVRPATSLALILMALTAPVAPACKVTPRASTNTPRTNITSEPPSISKPTRPRT